MSASTLWFVCGEDGWSSSIPSPASSASSAPAPLVLGRGKCNIDMEQHTMVSRKQVELLAIDDCSVQLKVVGNPIRIDPPLPTGAAARPSTGAPISPSIIPPGTLTVPKGGVATLQAHQRFYIPLSARTAKCFTVLSKSSPAPPPSSADSALQPARPARPPVSHKRPLPGDEDEYGWSIHNYPADKRARVRLANADRLTPSQESELKLSPESDAKDKLSQEHKEPPRTSSSSLPFPFNAAKGYKQTTLPFSQSPRPAPSPTALTFDSTIAGYDRFAFPCLCLGEGRLDVEKAVDVAAQSIELFLSLHPSPSIHLVLCEDDLALYQAILADLRSHHAELLPDSPLSLRFSLLCQSVALLPEAHRCATVVNCTDWKWATGGDKRRRALNAACGGKLGEWTEKALGTGKVGRVGEAYAVKLKEQCALSDHGVRMVVQVVPPSFNPARSDYVGDAPRDGEHKGLQLLRNTYAAMLDAWFYTLHPHAARPAAPVDRAPAAAQSSLPLLGDLTLSLVDDDLPESFAAFPLPPYAYPQHAWDAGPLAGWQSSLSIYLRSARAPLHRPAIYCEDRRALAIYDRYPKSRIHLLILSKRAPPLPSVSSLDASSLPVLHELKQRADAIVDHLSNQFELPSSRFLVGFHALPSLSPLHVHVLSADLSSVHLKLKKHYNSFTTPFFLPLDQVIERVQQDGRLTVDEARMKEYEKQPLRCWHCRTAIATMPALRQHLLNCRASPT